MKSKGLESLESFLKKAKNKKALLKNVARLFRAMKYRKSIKLNEDGISTECQPIASIAVTTFSMY